MHGKKSPFVSRVVLALAVVFGLAVATQSAQAQKFKVLHTFHGKDGASPVGVLVRDAAGNLYGTTGGGGTGKCSQYGCGTAFKLDRTGKQVWLYSFKGGNGQSPYAGLLRDSAGNLSGTTVYGGTVNNYCSNGCGVAFKLDRTGKKETVLHKFNGTPDGYNPESLLVGDPKGNTYGTTHLGGASGGYGTVFQLNTAGSETALYNFAGQPDGAFPDSGVIRDSAGDLFGVTFAGGDYNEGAAYEVAANGNETVLYSFAGSSDGAQPDSGLLLDSQGNLYGTTANGGNGQCGGTGCGVVFKLSPQSGGAWSETVLYEFCSLSNCADGEAPVGPLIMDSAGNLYGTTYFGGASHNCDGAGCGAVFKLDRSGKETVLHSFTGGRDGAYPGAGLVMDGHGALYGPAELGGATCYTSYTCGVVFKITP